MIRSFLNVLLPEDEYKRLRILYFIAEAAVLMAVTGIVLMGVDIYIFHWDLYPLWIVPYVLIAYVAIRYWSAGMEFGDVGTKSEYRKRKRQVWEFALLTAVSVFVLNCITSKVWTDWWIAIDKLGYSIVFFILVGGVSMFSLKRSYARNRETLEDEEDPDEDEGN